MFLHLLICTLVVRRSRCTEMFLGQAWETLAQTDNLFSVHGCIGTLNRKNHVAALAVSIEIVRVIH